jgi:hypothetical protein
VGAVFKSLCKDTYNANIQSPPSSPLVLTNLPARTHANCLIRRLYLSAFGKFPSLLTVEV